MKTGSKSDVGGLGAALMREKHHFRLMLLCATVGPLAALAGGELLEAHGLWFQGVATLGCVIGCVYHAVRCLAADQVAMEMLIASAIVGSAMSGVDEEEASWHAGVAIGSGGPSPALAQVGNGD